MINGERNLTMLMDFYELTMANGYLENGMDKRIVTFDMFFRKIPESGGFAIFAGLEQVIEYIKGLHFDEDDIAYLKKCGTFSDEFIEYLRNFKFECDIWSLKEGTPMFPNEPILTVRGPAIQAQLLETMILVTINHQSLIATKANRICRAANGRAVAEFGARRAQGFDGANYGSRAAYIGGCGSVANVFADRHWGIKAVGTMAHSWVQMFDTEYEAFEAYAKVYPDNCTLLIDTYNVLHSGIVNAIKCFDEVLKPLNKRPVAVRIDSGDIAYLSKKIRKKLDEAGYSDCKIMASNSLDEYIIRDLLEQDAKIDLFGVGEKLITSAKEPVFGGVYKIVEAEDKNGNFLPKIKISESVGKITVPGFKRLYRIYEKDTNKAISDYITLRDEVLDVNKPLELFDPNATWKRKTVTEYYAKELLVPVFEKGQLVYDMPSVQEIHDYCKQEIDELWDEMKRMEFPHQYHVDLSQKLYDLKQKMISDASK